MAGTVMLRAELTTLVGQTKKRSAPLRVASEKSLAALDMVVPAENGEVPNGDLRGLAANSDFITPFLLACSESNAKSCASALQCLQILASVQAISLTRLHELLGALMDATRLGIGIQLKILQLLPVLLQGYAAELNGAAIAELLQVCAELHGENKVGMVHNAAYATLQQLITGIFDRIDQERSGTGDVTVTVEEGGKAREFQVTPHVQDAVLILLDFCEIANNRPPSFLKSAGLPVTFMLELLELTLTNHSAVFHAYPVFGIILRHYISPFLIRLFSESTDFPVTVRVTRMFYLLLRRHLDLVSTEAEVILSLLTQTAKQGILWKRILCLEVFQGMFLEFNLLLQVSRAFRGSPVLREVLSSFAFSLVHNDGCLLLATTSPTGATESTDAVSRPSTPSSGHPAPLSRQFVAKVPFIDLLDKSDPPRASEHYLYYLVFICITSLADGISKAPKASVDLDDSDDFFPNLLTEIEDPLVNCYTVFLGTSMDIELYKQLVRSVQRMAHKCGTLGLDSERDYYIKLLIQFSYLAHDPQLRSALLQRNTLCIRALLNLGYALGNKLGPSWTLLVDCIGNLSVQINAEAYVPTSDELLGGQDAFKAIESSLQKLLDSTADLDDQAIVYFFKALGRRDQIRPLYVVILGVLANVNAERFSVYPSQCWECLVDILLSLIRDNTLDERLCLSSAKVLNKAIFEALEAASSGEAYKNILAALVKQVNLDNKVHDGFYYDIQAEAIGSLSRLLDQFGSQITAGWEEIFIVISSVFRVLGPSVRPAVQTEMIKGSFHSLALICTDFLDHLPYHCVFDLTLTLDRFARQDVDINTAFTSISLFWTVCDHLMRGAPELSTFPSVTNVGDLVELAKSGSEVKQYALWMLALIKLAEIADEPQHQIKTGAVQIFFRLLESHDTKLPPVAWTICENMVFPKIMKVKLDSEAREATETQSLIINGLGSIYTNQLKVLTSQPGFKEAWCRLIKFYQAVIKGSASNALNVYQNLFRILDNAARIKCSKVGDEAWKLWVAQNADAGSDTESPKQTAESLKALIELYPMLVAVQAPTKDQQLRSLELIRDCATHYDTSFRGGKGKISSLQDCALNALKVMELVDTELAISMVEKLAKLSVLPYSDVEIPGESCTCLSERSLSQLCDFLDSPLLNLLQRSQCLEAYAEETRHSLNAALCFTLDCMIQIMGFQQTMMATKVYLKILSFAKGLKLPDQHKYLVAGRQTIFEGSYKAEHEAESEPQSIAAITAYIDILEQLADSSQKELWKTVLESLTINTLLYERGNMARETVFDPPDKFVGLADGPFHGSIDKPVPSQRQPIAYHCLSMLKRLASSPDCVPVAYEFYESRVIFVLYQLVSDAQLRGKEPMPTLMRDELQFILHQLEQVRLSPEVKRLLTRCLGLGDSTSQSMTQKILLGS